METVYRNKGTEQGEEPMRIESLSRPGLVHFVSADFRHCSCEAKTFGTVEVCGHIRRAKIRAAKAAESRFEVRCVHNSRFGDYEYAIVKESGEVLGFRPTRQQAELDITDIVSGLEVA